MFVSLQGYHFQLHFTDEETEAQGTDVAWTCYTSD